MLVAADKSGRRVPTWEEDGSGFEVEGVVVVVAEFDSPEGVPDEDVCCCGG